nr:hypothetical protein [Lysobacter enzymogenes]
MTHVPDEHDLHAYIDGRLDPARRAEVEAWLARQPERLAELQAWQRDAQQLRAALAGAARRRNRRWTRAPARRPRPPPQRATRSPRRCC